MDEHDVEREAAQGAQIVKAQTHEVAPLEDARFRIMEYVEMRSQLQGRIMKLLAMQTKPTDWVDLGGKPYLQASGTLALANMLGICIKPDTQHIRQRPGRDEDGPYVDIALEVRGWLAGFPGYEITTYGKASTRDPWFRKAHGNIKPLESIDMNNVVQKAITNGLNKALKALCGITNLTWDDLREAGIVQGEVSKVDYKTKGKSAPKTRPASTGSGPSDGSMTVDQKRVEIVRMIEQVVGKDGFAQTMRELTHREYKGRQYEESSVDELRSDAAVHATYRKVCEWFNNQQPPPVAEDDGFDPVNDDIPF